MPDPKPLSAEEVIKLFDDAFKSYEGNSHELESAIGSYVIGRQLGWKPLVLMHDKTTLAKYGKILGVDFREHLPPVGRLAPKSKAWKAVLTVGNFWKAVKGEIKNVRTAMVTKR